MDCRRLSEPRGLLQFAHGTHRAEPCLYYAARERDTDADTSPHADHASAESAVDGRPIQSAVLSDAGPRDARPKR